jgi:hypothetical protein
MYREKDTNGNLQCIICGTQKNLGTHHGSMPGMMWVMCDRHRHMASLRESRNDYYRKQNMVELAKMELDEEKYLIVVAYERSIVKGSEQSKSV